MVWLIQRSFKVQGCCDCGLAPWTVVQTAPVAENWPREAHLLERANNAQDNVLVMSAIRLKECVESARWPSKSVNKTKGEFVLNSSNSVRKDCEHALETQVGSNVIKIAKTCKVENQLQQGKTSDKCN